MLPRLTVSAEFNWRSTIIGPLTCLLVVGALLGVTANLVKLATASGWPALAFMFWATLGAGFVLLAVVIASANAPRLNSRTLQFNVISGALSIALPNALVFAAIPHVGAAFVSLCMALPPLLTYGFALTLGMERLRALRAIGVLFGLAGAIGLGLAKSSSGAAASLWIFAVLAGAVCITFGNFYRTLAWPPGASAQSLAPGMLLGGAALLWLAMLVFGANFSSPTLTFEAFWLLAGQIVVFSATYLLYFVLQKLAGPVYLSQIGSVGAVSGSALAVFAFGEPAGPILLLAAASILFGVFLVNWTH
jgi:drug/metabolite transporter (DMT)-like permease